MATIATLDIAIRAPTAKFERGLGSAAKSLKRFAGVAAGALAIRGIGQQAAEIDALAKTADKLGIGVESLQGLRRAGELSGVGVNTLEMALQRMTRRVNEAAHGTGEAKGALQELGVDAAALARTTPDQVFFRLADAMANVPSQADKVRLAFKLFDSEGVALVNTLSMGSNQLREIQSQMERTGQIIDASGAKSVERLNDAWTILGGFMDQQFKRLLAGTSELILKIGGVNFDALVAEFGAVEGAMADMTARMKELEAETNRLNKIKEFIGNLEEQVALVGALASSVDTYKLSMMVATQAEIQHVRELHKSLEAYERIQKEIQDTDRRLKEFQTRAELVFESMRTPFEKVASDIDNLDELFKRQLITLDTYRRALKNIGIEAQKAGEARTESAAVGFGRETRAATDAFFPVAQRMLMRVEDPQLKLTNELLAQQNEILRRLEDRGVGAARYN